MRFFIRLSKCNAIAFSHSLLQASKSLQNIHKNMSCFVFLYFYISMFILIFQIKILIFLIL